MITRWTEEEDNVLRYLVRQHGVKAWTQIATQICEMIGHRTGKQCRLRWLHTLSPAVNNEPWTAEEEETLFQQQELLGNRWARIARALPGRTDSSCKNRWYSSLRHGIRRIVKANHAAEQLFQAGGGADASEYSATATSSSSLIHTDRLLTTIERVASEGPKVGPQPQDEVAVAANGSGDIYTGSATGSGAGAGAGASAEPALVEEEDAYEEEEGGDALFLSKLPLTLRRAVIAIQSRGSRITRARKRPIHVTSTDATSQKPLALSSLSSAARQLLLSVEMDPNPFAHVKRSHGVSVAGHSFAGSSAAAVESASAIKRTKLSIITKDLKVIQGLLSLTPIVGGEAFL
jgi:hypothetical protein